jgi:signal transduction histidine kinase
MQQKKADELGVRLWAEFGNFAWTDQKVLLDTVYSPIIVSDEARIIQVLLALQSNALKCTEKGEVKISAEMI